MLIIFNKFKLFTCFYKAILPEIDKGISGVNG